MAVSDREKNKKNDWRLNMPKPARTAIFIGTRIILAAIFIFALTVGFRTGMDSMNAYTMIKDGFALRAQAVMKPTENDAEKLSKYFTQHELLSDEMLNGDTFKDHDVSNYYERLDAGTIIVWPWQDECRFRVIEQVMDIKGTYSSSFLMENGLTEEDISEAEVVMPEWKNGEYEIVLLRPKTEDESWKIDSITYLGPAEDKMMKVYEDEEDEKIPESVTITPEGGKKVGGGTVIQETEEEE